MLSKFVVYDVLKNIAVQADRKGDISEKAMFAGSIACCASKVVSHASQKGSAFVFGESTTYVPLTLTAGQMKELATIATSAGGKKGIFLLPGLTQAYKDADSAAAVLKKNASKPASAFKVILCVQGKADSSCNAVDVQKLLANGDKPAPSGLCDAVYQRLCLRAGDLKEGSLNDLKEAATTVDVKKNKKLHDAEHILVCGQLELANDPNTMIAGGAAPAWGTFAKANGF